MSNVIEKEVRGALNKEIAKKIRIYAKEAGWKEHTYRQVSIYCDTDHIPMIGSVAGGKGRLIIDIRDSAIKIKIKLGNALNFERKEYTIMCSAESYEAIGVLLKVFDVKNGFVRTFDRTDYVTFDGVQLTIKLNCLMGDHYELERNSDNPSAVQTFNDILKDLSLMIWTKEELAQAIQNDHDKVVAQDICEFLKGFNK